MQNKLLKDNHTPPNGSVMVINTGLKEKWLKMNFLSG